MATDATTYSVAEIANAAGLTVRTVRSHQSRGLLPPPQIVDRQAVYSAGHLTRLQRIVDLQERGYSLAAIADALSGEVPLHERDGGAHIAAAAADLAMEETAVVVPTDALLAMLVASGGDESVLDLLLSTELVDAVDADNVRIVSPEVMKAGQALIAAGAPPEDVIALQGRIRDATSSIADDMAKVILEHVALPGIAAAEGPDDLAALASTLQSLRPVATRVTAALLNRGLDDRLASFLSDIDTP